MPKGIVVNALSNKIEYATHNGKGIITGNRHDITDCAVDAVFLHLKKEFEEKGEKGSVEYGYSYGDKGKLVYVKN